MASKLDQFMAPSEFDLDAAITEAETELKGGDGHVRPGDVCRHVDLPDFLCKVVIVDDGRCRVEVLDGWRGRKPLGSVSVPTAKLEVI